MAVRSAAQKRAQLKAARASAAKRRGTGKTAKTETFRKKKTKKRRVFTKNTRRKLAIRSAAVAGGTVLAAHGIAKISVHGRKIKRR